MRATERLKHVLICDRARNSLPVKAPQEFFPQLSTLALTIVLRSQHVVS